jgi:integrase
MTVSSGATSKRYSQSSTRAGRRLRSKGSGGVFELRPGVWRIDVEARRDPDTGARRRVSKLIYGERVDAELALANLKVTASQQRRSAPFSKAKTMRSIFDLYLDDAKEGKIELEVKTQVTSKSAARTMCKQRLSDGQLFGEMRPSRLNWEDIENLYATMKANGLGAPWIRRCATVLNQALDYARKRHVIDANPCADAKRPRTVRSKPYSPPASLVDALTESLRARAAAAETAAEARDFEEICDAVEVVSGSGVRKGELLALFVEDVDLRHDEMHVAFAISDGGPGVGLVRKPTKESDWRDIPLLPSVKAAFERQLARREEQSGVPLRPNEYIFAGDVDGSRPIRPDTFSDRLAVARGTSDLTLQDLRHFVATKMLDAGIPYRTVADLLGNSEVTLRLHYDGRTDTGKRNALSTLANRAG